MSPLASHLAKLSPWWGILVLTFAAGAFVRGTEKDVQDLKAQVPAKVDTMEYRRDIRQLSTKLDSTNLRLAQVLCNQRPAYCR